MRLRKLCCAALHAGRTVTASSLAEAVRHAKDVKVAACCVLSLLTDLPRKSNLHLRLNLYNKSVHSSCQLLSGSAGHMGCWLLMENDSCVRLRGSKQCQLNLQVLNLAASEDLLCKNIMCEHVGDPCICRLSAALDKLPNVEELDISDNKLTALPEAIGRMPKLLRLNVRGNQLQETCATLQEQFPNAEVLNFST